MNEEIFYILAYNNATKKWRSADEMIGVFTEGDGPVRVIKDEETVEWREVEDGIEKDIDFDNTILLTAFLRDVNNQDKS